MRRQSDLDDIYGVKGIKTNPLDQDDDVPETGFRHSDSYHRHFRGYTEIRVPKENGRFDIQRFYTQPWIVSTASTKNYWLKRALMIALLIFSWGAYIYGMCLPLDSNRWFLTAIPGLGTVVALVVLGVVLLNCLFVRKKMTLWEFESTSKRLKQVSAIAAGCAALTALTKLFYLLFAESKAAGEAVSCALILAAALAVAGIYILERAAEYTTAENDTVLPEGEAHEIW